MVYYITLGCHQGCTGTEQKTPKSCATKTRRLSKKLEIMSDVIHDLKTKDSLSRQAVENIQRFKPAFW